MFSSRPNRPCMYIERGMIGEVAIDSRLLIGRSSYIAYIYLFIYLYFFYICIAQIARSSSLSPCFGTIWNANEEARLARCTQLHLQGTRNSNLWRRGNRVAGGSFRQNLFALAEAVLDTEWQPIPQPCNCLTQARRSDMILSEQN
jgi:hypothetical protein